MSGSERRQLLQRIRKEIAEKNGIVYMQSEEHDDNCAGDCRVCRAEARYIDSELSYLAKQGKDIKLASILGDLIVVEKETVLEKEIVDCKGKTVEKEIIDKKEMDQGDGSMLIDELELTIHLDNALRSYGINTTDELYAMLKGDSMNMKKKLRGGYKYLVGKLKELGYEITKEMG